MDMSTCLSPVLNSVRLTIKTNEYLGRKSSQMGLISLDGEGKDTRALVVPCEDTVRCKPGRESSPGTKADYTPPLDSAS